MVVAEFKKSMDELVMACETIRGADRCAMCPLKDVCLDDTSLIDVAYNAKAKAIERFLCMADKVTEDMEEAEKSEYQKAWEYTADRWLDRGKEI